MRASQSEGARPEHIGAAARQAGRSSAENNEVIYFNNLPS